MTRTNDNFDLISKNRVASHVLFWGVLFIVDLFRDLIVNFERKDVTVGKILIYNLAESSTVILASYIIVYLLIPKIIAKKQYVSAVFFFFFMVYLIGALSRVLIVHVVEPIIRTLPFEQESILEILLDYRYLIRNYIPNVLLNSFVFISVKSLLDKEREKAKRVQLSKEKTEIELKTLKAQLNPHFLFNTLNNIYSLSVVGSPKTSESIAKLSEILDYLLYKSEGKFVSVKNELILLENYIELERLRYDERLDVVLNSNLNDECSIPPLILISLVENAFKHGAGEDSGSPKIIISLKTAEDIFEFKVVNSVFETKKLIQTNSIGLSNIRKQLDLIYGDGYSLETTSLENKFSVVLRINYNS